VVESLQLVGEEPVGETCHVFWVCIEAGLWEVGFCEGEGGVDTVQNTVLVLVEWDVCKLDQGAACVELVVDCEALWVKVFGKDEFDVESFEECEDTKARTCGFLVFGFENFVKPQENLTAASSPIEAQGPWSGA
jgi:hypothetical protein